MEWFNSFHFADADEDEDDMQLSPLSDGETCLSTVVENKIVIKFDEDKVNSQLLANMIVSCGETLYDNLKTSKWTKKNIVDCRKLTTYGINCSRVGTFGMLKLTVNFTKHEMFAK